MINVTPKSQEIPLIESNPRPPSISQRIRNLINRVSDLTEGYESVANPVHPAFNRAGEGWHWNRVSEPSLLPEVKVRVFFNDSHLALLDGCNFPCKFALNQDPDHNDKPYKYIGFAYPGSPRQVELLEQWAAKFPHADLCSYGTHLISGGWIPGKPLKEISRQTQIGD